MTEISQNSYPLMAIQQDQEIKITLVCSVLLCSHLDHPVVYYSEGHPDHLVVYYIYYIDRSRLHHEATTVYYSCLQSFNLQEVVNDTQCALPSVQFKILLKCVNSMKTLWIILPKLTTIMKHG